jgi:hypothetical protein
VADLHPDRARVVTASEAAAMMGESSHQSPYGLWAVKTGLAEPENLDANKRVFWGKIMEPAIEDGVRLITGWDVRRCQKFIRHPDPAVPLGATPDCLIVPRDKDTGEAGPYGSWGALELKAMDLMAYLKLPDFDGDRGIVQLDGATWRVPKKSPPAEYLIQLQVQMDCLQLSWGVLAILVGGNDLQLWRYNAHLPALAAIRTRAAEFMRMVEAREEHPPINWETDTDAIRNVYRLADPGRIIVGDDALQALALRYEELGKAKSTAENDRDIVAAKILASIGDAVEAKLPNGKRITASVVGETRVEAYTRKAYRPVYVREPKKEKR